MKRPHIQYIGDERVRGLLRTYCCPTPFHAVRTRFLGNIASPRLDASPIEAIKDLWGGELPAFEEMGEINQLFGGLMSLWNHLARHQSRSKPFRLARGPSKAGRDELLALCRTRTEELEGFVDGLYGNEERLDLPESAVEALEYLGEANALVHGILRLLENPDQSPTEEELAGTFQNVRELSRIAEKELHAVVLACVRARREVLSQPGGRRGRVH